MRDSTENIYARFKNGTRYISRAHYCRCVKLGRLIRDSHWTIQKCTAWTTCCVLKCTRLDTWDTGPMCPRPDIPEGSGGAYSHSKCRNSEVRDREPILRIDSFQNAILTDLLCNVGRETILTVVNNAQIIHRSLISPFSK